MAKTKSSIVTELKRESKRKVLSGFGLLITSLIIILVGVVSLGCSNTTTPNKNSNTVPTKSANNEPEVVYEITGTATRVDVMLNDDNGELEDHSNVAVGTKFTFDKYSNNYAFITAKNLGETGSVTVNIYHKGELVKSETREGSHVIASTSYFK